MSLSVANMIVQEANAQGVDPNLALQVAATESNFDQSAVSPKGAVGVFQLMPSSFPGVNIYDLATNIRTGIGYLRELIGQYGGNLQEVLAAYNWGPGNLQNAQASAGSDWLSVAPAETQSYVSKILNSLGQSVSSAAESLFGAPISLLPSTSVADAVQPGIASAGGALLLLGGIGLVAAWLLFSD